MKQGVSALSGIKCESIFTAKPVSPGRPVRPCLPYLKSNEFAILQLYLNFSDTSNISSYYLDSLNAYQRRKDIKKFKHALMTVERLPGCPGKPVAPL
jgi:hypothetical protein